MARPDDYLLQKWQPIPYQGRLGLRRRRPSTGGIAKLLRGNIPAAITAAITTRTVTLAFLCVVISAGFHASTQQPIQAGAAHAQFFSYRVPPRPASGGINRAFRSSTGWRIASTSTTAVQQVEMTAKGCHSWWWMNMIS
jgi:hypothetical protein